MNAPIWSWWRPALPGFVALFVLIFGFGAWSALAPISGAVVAHGRLEVEQNRQIVQHPDGGIVEQILTREGDTVSAGDILIRLDSTLLHSELAIVDGRLSEGAARRARLEAERDGNDEVEYPAALLEAAARRPEIDEQVTGQTRLFRASVESAAREAEQLQRQIGQIRKRIEGIDAQRAAVVSQAELTQRELASQQTLLDKGLAQEARVLALQRELARLQGTAGELIANRAQAEERITEIEVQTARADAQRREEAARQLRDLDPVNMELFERRQQLLEKIARLDIRAPVSGVVLGLVVTTPRSVIRAADPILYIVPQDRPLAITVQVDPIHVDQVYPGQVVELSFPALSGRTTPHLDGKVTLVSPDVFTDQTSGAGFYRVAIDLDPGELSRLGAATLVPGMPVEAFIRTDTRTPLSWLLKPFTDYFKHAMRER